MLLGVLLAVLLTSQVKGQENICEKRVDLAFVIDGSRSIRKEYFQLQTEFVAQIIGLFTISPSQTQVAALTFSDRVRIDFNFNTFNNVQDLTRNVSKLAHQVGGTTNTYDGLEKMRTKLFAPSNGARDDAAHICIVLTDGVSYDQKATIRQAQLAREAGISMYAIGVGDKINEDELRAMVSPPAEEHMFIVDKFEKLDDAILRKEVVNKTCESLTTTTTTTTTLSTTTTTTTEPTTTTTEITTTTTQPTTTTSPQKTEPDKQCQGKSADVIFVIDRSASIWAEDFRKQMKFVADLISHFDVESGKTRVGVVTFNTVPRLEFYLNDFMTAQQMRARLTAIDDVQDLTNTHLALNLVVEEMMLEKHGFRPGVGHIVIILTDGLSRDRALTLEASKKLHNTGAYVFAIGIGNMTDIGELRDMASKPIGDEQFVFEVNGFAMLPTIEDILAFKTCEVTPNDAPGCTRSMNAKILFALHGVGGEFRAAATEFIKSVGGSFDLESGNVQVGVVENCREANIGLGQQDTKAGFVEAIEGEMVRPIGNFIKSFRTTLGPASRQSGDERIVVLMVSGEIDDIELAKHQARLLKVNTKVIVVGLGSSFVEEQLMELATSRGRGPDISHVFPVRSAEELKDIVTKILVLMCNEQK